MMKRPFMILALAAALCLSMAGAPAAETEAAKEKPKAQKQEPIYGSQLMTREERAEYRAKMRAAKTAEEREKIRNEHHEQMKARAKERGITLPDMPPAKESSMMPCGKMAADGGMGTGCGGMGGCGCGGMGGCSGMGSGGGMGGGCGGMGAGGGMAPQGK